MRIVIGSQCIQANDAVSNDCVGMARALTRRGHDVRLVADGGVYPSAEVHRFANIQAFVDSADMFIYHCSIGWDNGQAQMDRFKGKRVVKYHNITPSSYFKDVCDVLYQVTELGRAELPKVAKAKYDIYLADSQFNADELLQLGTESVQVVPPFHQTDELVATEPQHNLFDVYNDWRTNILMVGRLAPNKGHLAAIDGFARYKASYDHDAPPDLGGDRRSPAGALQPTSTSSHRPPRSPRFGGGNE
jgi:glycosyltransferase involved in cell wall biosynthesis